MAEWPEVSVVIPTRNRAGLLASALRSALSQVDVELEVVVVDEASTDETPVLLSHCEDSRVRHFRHASPRGVAAARNRAVAEARGEWIAFLDDDDLWAPEWLISGLRAAGAAGAGFVYTSRWVVDGERRVRGALLAERPENLPEALADHNAIGGPSCVIVHRDALSAAGGFDERLSALADWDMWIRLLDVSTQAAVPELLTAYTIYPDNMHLRAPFGVQRELRVLARLVEERGGRVGALHEARFLRWLAVENARWGYSVQATRLWLHSARRARKPGHVLRAAMAFRGWGRMNGTLFAVPEWLQPLAAGDSRLTAPIRLPR